jgi:hypothetical protein
MITILQVDEACRGSLTLACNLLGAPGGQSFDRLTAPCGGGKGTDVKQLTTEQRLARLIELKEQRDEIDQEIAVLLGDDPPPRRGRPSARGKNSGTGHTVNDVSHARTEQSANTGSSTAFPNRSAE